MGKRPSIVGQTQVEVALVLPCILFGIFMAVRLIVYGHNMLELARMAQVMADRQDYGHRNSLREYWKFNSLWGRRVVDPIKVSSERPVPWRPFRGLSTVKENGWFIRVRVGARLVPGFLQQRGYAHTYFEPPIPPEE